MRDSLIPYRVTRRMAIVAGLALPAALFAREQPTGASTPGSAVLPATSPATRPAGFPHTWVGHWKGPMGVESARGRQALKMELIVAATDDPDVFDWKIVYDGPAGRQERAYQLRVVDVAKGLFDIDERNGIVLRATLVSGDTLLSAFDVGPTRLVSSYRLNADGTLDSQIVSTRAPDKLEGSHQVGSGIVVGYQQATLRRSQEP